MSGRGMTVLVPMCPPKACSPNGGWHWRAKADAKAQLRMAAKGAALNARWQWLGNPTFSGGVPEHVEIWVDDGKPVPLHGAIFEGPVLVRVCIGWGKGRRMADSDNALACCKSAIDGCTDAAIWVDDKQCSFAPVVQVRDEDGAGFVRLEIAEVAPAVGAEPGGSG